MALKFLCLALRGTRIAHARKGSTVVPNVKPFMVKGLKNLKKTKCAETDSSCTDSDNKNL